MLFHFLTQLIFDCILFFIDDDEDEYQDRDNILHVPEGSPTMLRRCSASTAGDGETHASTPNREMEKEDSGLPLGPIADRFGKKMKKGTIDVWWLFDDGGRYN